MTLDLARGRDHALGEVADLGSHHGEATAGLARPRSLDRGIERQQAGLEGDRVDQRDDAGDLLRRGLDAVNRRVGGIDRHPHLLDRARHRLGLGGARRGLARILGGGDGDFLDRGRGLLHRRGAAARAVGEIAHPGLQLALALDQRARGIDDPGDDFLQTQRHVVGVVLERLEGAVIGAGDAPCQIRLGHRRQHPDRLRQPALDDGDELVHLAGQPVQHLVREFVVDPLGEVARHRGPHHDAEGILQRLHQLRGLGNDVDRRVDLGGSLQEGPLQPPERDLAGGAALAGRPRRQHRLAHEGIARVDHCVDGGDEIRQRTVKSRDHHPRRQLPLAHGQAGVAYLADHPVGERDRHEDRDAQQDPDPTQSQPDGLRHPERTRGEARRHGPDHQQGEDVDPGA